MHALQEVLKSYVNTYRLVMWHLNQSGEDSKTLASELGMTDTCVRMRRKKPGQWRVAEVAELANYFGLSVSSCIRMQELLKTFKSEYCTLSTRQRKELEQYSLIAGRRFMQRSDHNWTSGELERLSKALEFVLE